MDEEVGKPGRKFTPEREEVRIGKVVITLPLACFSLNKSL
jgi:hypothetical protein